MRRRALTLGAAAVLVAIVVVLWCLTIPATVPAAALPPHAPDVANGRTMFEIGGCASCHATPADDAEKVDRTKLGGGLPLKSPFGTFYVPNISEEHTSDIQSQSKLVCRTPLEK